MIDVNETIQRTVSEKVDFKLAPSRLVDYLRKYLYSKFIFSVPNEHGVRGDTIDTHTNKVQKYLYSGGHNNDDWYDDVRDLTPSEIELVSLIDRLYHLVSDRTTSIDE